MRLCMMWASTARIPYMTVDAIKKSFICECPEAHVKYCTATTEFNCGIDLHAKQMHACILDRQGQVLVRRNIRGNEFGHFLKLAKPAFADVWVVPRLTAVEFRAAAGQWRSFRFVVAGPDVAGHCLNRHVKATHGRAERAQLQQSGKCPKTGKNSPDGSESRFNLDPDWFHLWRGSQ